MAVKKAQFMKHSKSDERIVGGQNVTNLNDMPYFASIQANMYGNWFHYCSGAIYNSDTIITSAECRVVSGMDRVVTGKIKLSQNEEKQQVS